MPALVAQFDARLTGDQEVQPPPGWQHSVVEIDHWNIFYIHSLPSADSTGFIHIGEMSGKFNFFQGQVIVREFYDVSGKNEILQKCQGNVRELYILSWWS